MGICRTSVRNPNNNKKYSVEFTVVKEDLTLLIGLRAAEQKKLITVNDKNIAPVASLTCLNGYDDVFDGKLGTLPDEIHLRTAENVTPVIMPTRRVPISLRDRLKEELDRLLILVSLPV